MRHANRHSSKQPHRTENWCHACDRAIVSPDKKCPRCGHVNNLGKTTFKKAPVVFLEEIYETLSTYKPQTLPAVPAATGKGCPAQVKIDLTDALYKIKMKLKMLH